MFCPDSWAAGPIVRIGIVLHGNGLRVSLRHNDQCFDVGVRDDGPCRPENTMKFSLVYTRPLTTTFLRLNRLRASERRVAL